MTRILFIFLMLALAGPAAAQQGEIVTAGGIDLGATGVRIRTGTADPTGGSLGDLYIETDTGYLWQKLSTGWVVVASFGATTANQIFAGPASGEAALPAFRSTVKADLPAEVAYTDEANVFTQHQIISGENPFLWILGASNTAALYPHIWLDRSRGTIDTPLSIQAGDLTGAIFSQALTAEWLVGAADIRFYADAIVDDDYIDGRIQFRVNDGTDWYAATEVFNLTADEAKFHVDALPSAGYSGNLGLLNRKWLTLHAAELWVESLVAQDTMATIGGRILVGPTTTLTEDLASGAAAIAVKHDNLADGDRVYLESGGAVEFLAITSAASGDGPYTYSVTRDLDGSGANEWPAGSAVFNTGTTGNGFIDLYSARGVKSGSEYGPTIVGNVRTGSDYNAWAPRWAIGNLDGLYGYSETYGAAFGDPDGAWLKIDPTNGVRIGHDATTKVHIDASGDASFAGQITSTSGAIGGWTIGATALTAGSGTNTVGLDSVAGASPVIYAGSNTPTAAPFRVYADGSVVATKLEVSATPGAGGNMIQNSSLGVTYADGQLPPGWLINWHTRSGCSQNYPATNYGVNYSGTWTLVNGGTLWAARTQPTYPTGECFDIIAWDGARGVRAIPVVAGSRYETSVYAASTDGIRGVRPFVVWYSGPGVYLTTSYGTERSVVAAGGQALSQYTRIFDFFVAPANTAYAVVGYAAFYDQSGGSPYVFYARPQFAEASATQASPSMWAPSGTTQIVGDEITTGAITASKIAAGSVTADKISVTNLAAVKAQTGALTVDGALTVSTSGVIKSGATDYSTGTGWYMDYNAGTPRFRIGNPAGNQLTWNGSALSITGAVTATSGVLGDLTINGDLDANGLSIGDSGLYMGTASSGSDYARMIYWGNGSMIAERTWPALHLNGPYGEGYATLNLYTNSAGLWGVANRGVYLTSGAFAPENNDTLDLGTPSIKWSNGYFYRTVYAGEYFAARGENGVTGTYSCGDGIYQIEISGGIITDTPICVAPGPNSLQAQIDVLREEVMRLRALLEVHR